MMIACMFIENSRYSDFSEELPPCTFSLLVKWVKLETALTLGLISNEILGVVFRCEPVEDDRTLGPCSAGHREVEVWFCLPKQISYMVALLQWKTNTKSKPVSIKLKLEISVVSRCPKSWILIIFIFGQANCETSPMYDYNIYLSGYSN